MGSLGYIGLLSERYIGLLQGSYNSNYPPENVLDLDHSEDATTIEGTCLNYPDTLGGSAN